MVMNEQIKLGMTASFAGVSNLLSGSWYILSILKNKSNSFLKLVILARRFCSSVPIYSIKLISFNFMTVVVQVIVLVSFLITL